MFVKYTTASVAASALLATVAFAQTPATSTDHTNMAPGAAASSTTSASSYQGDWRTSKLIGVKVYNNENESIGSISDLLTDKSGNIKAAVIGVGGFLGVGEHLVAVAFDQLKFVDQPVPSTTSSAAPPAGTRPASTTTTGAAGTNTAPSSMSSTKSDPWYPDHAVLNATKDQLKQMPEFKYSTN